MADGYYARANGCDEALHAYCEAKCPLDGPLVARYDGPGGDDRWRCFTLETLSADTRRYVSGSAYCTRNRGNQLPGALAACAQRRDAVRAKERRDFYLYYDD